jgi:hypothetical protein
VSHSRTWLRAVPLILSLMGAGSAVAETIWVPCPEVYVRHVFHHAFAGPVRFHSHHGQKRHCKHVHIVKMCPVDVDDGGPNGSGAAGGGGLGYGGGFSDLAGGYAGDGGDASGSGGLSAGNGGERTPLADANLDPPDYGLGGRFPRFPPLDCDPPDGSTPVGPAVPEASTYFMMLLGFAGLSIPMRRKKCRPFS